MAVPELWNLKNEEVHFYYGDNLIIELVRQDAIYTARVRDKQLGYVVMHELERGTEAEMRSWLAEYREVFSQQSRRQAMQKIKADYDEYYLRRDRIFLHRPGNEPGFGPAMD